VVQLVAELQARGLMTEGSRRELYKRVQVMHLHEPVVTSADAAVVAYSEFIEWYGTCG
jgi:hypothetical protein